MNSHKGISTSALLIAVGVLVIAGGVGYYAFYRTTPTAIAPTLLPSPTPSMTGKLAPTPLTPAGTPSHPAYDGQRLAGTNSPLLVFNKADFEAALQSDQLVALYFYANWCPICRAEFPKMEEAFDELATSNVIGFRVNFNDNETDADEVALARQYGVAYQHTKVFIKNGQQILKSPESWEKDRYLTEISNAVQ